jgi:hypothetical protein
VKYHEVERTKLVMMGSRFPGAKGARERKNNKEKYIKDKGLKINSQSFVCSLETWKPWPLETLLLWNLITP